MAHDTQLPLTEAEIEEMRAERDRVGTHTAESLRLVDRNARAADEVDRLRSLCAQMYQVAGALLFEYEGDFGVEVLDNLSDAASGNPLRHETLLPFVLPENRAKQPEGAAPGYYQRCFYPGCDDQRKDSYAHEPCEKSDAFRRFGRCCCEGRRDATNCHDFVPHDAKQAEGLITKEYAREHGAVFPGDE